MNALTLALLTVLVPAVTHACIQGGDSHVHLPRHDTLVHDLRRVMHTNPASLSAADKFARGRTPEQIAEFNAINHIYRGELADALSLLQGVEKSSSGRYTTAANIGTVYELMGDNPNALKWIKEGLRRNPESHQRTEWLHVVILEAKVAAGDDPGSSLKRPLIELPEALDERTRLVIQGRSLSMTDVREALHYQLHERLLFVKPKDPYVADLLHTLAVVETMFGLHANSSGLLLLAGEYGFADESLLARLEQKNHQLLANEKMTWWIDKGAPRIILPCLCVVLLLMYCHRRQWISLSRTPRAPQAPLSLQGN